MFRPAPAAGTPRAALCAALVFLLCPVSANAQEMSTGRSERPAWLDDHSPRGALIRSAVVPGWGQAYNRQYLKMPVVYAALGGLLANTIRLSDRYRLYRRAFQYKAFEELDPDNNPREDFLPAYQELLARTGASDISSAAISPIRDNLRRNRDLSIIGIGIVHALSVLDAYVSAHLLDFDVGEDLTVSVYPTPDGVGTRVLVRR